MNLLRLFVALSLPLLAFAQDARPGPTGTLAGVLNSPVKGETLAGVWVTLNRLPLSGERAFVPVSQRLQTGKDGSYSFSGLPLGRYEVCPQLPDSLYLSPCDWPAEGDSSGLGPLANLTAAAPQARLDLALLPGVVLNLRLEDGARRLETAARQSHQPAPFVGVVRANGLRSPAKPLFARNGLFVYSIVVPPGQTLRPVVDSATVEVEDAARQRLPQGLGSALTLAPGSAPTQVLFRVAGGKL